MKPKILVTNDDGFYSAGLRKLVKCVKDFGRIIVVAPSNIQSGSGHAMTVRDPLRLEEVCAEGNLREYICNGTPVDCVKMGRKVIIEGEPDLLVSGINHGQNLGVNVLYSGTMATAIEASIHGIPAIGFSFANYSFNAELFGIKKYIKQIIGHVLKNGIPKGISLNVNIPDTSKGPIKGIRICHQGKGHWRENFDARVDQLDRDYYWLSGSFEFSSVNDENSDEWAVENGYISVVPVKIDMTDYSMISNLKKWNFNGNI